MGTEYTQRNIEGEPFKHFSLDSVQELCENVFFWPDMNHIINHRFDMDIAKVFQTIFNPKARAHTKKEVQLDH